MWLYKIRYHNNFRIVHYIFWTAEEQCKCWARNRLKKKMTVIRKNGWSLKDIIWYFPWNSGMCVLTKYSGNRNWSFINRQRIKIQYRKNYSAVRIGCWKPNCRSCYEELIPQRNQVLVVCNNRHRKDLHVFSDVISRTNRYKAAINKKRSFFQFL